MAYWTLDFEQSLRGAQSEETKATIGLGYLLGLTPETPDGTFKLSVPLFARAGTAQAVNGTVSFECNGLKAHALDT